MNYWSVMFWTTHGVAPHLPWCHPVAYWLYSCSDTVLSAGDQGGLTPLHEAAGNGHLSLCKFIMENLEDKNPEDSDGFTPLHLAAQNR